MTAQAATVTNPISLDIIEPELTQSFAALTEILDTEQGAQWPAPMLDSIAQEIQMIAGIFKMVELHHASYLAECIVEAISTVKQTGRPINDKEKEALFHAVDILPKYFNFVRVNGEVNGLCLAPYFYRLTTQRLIPLIPEVQFNAFQFKLRSEFTQGTTFFDSSSITSDEKETIQRMRQMYQTALLGLLRGTNIDGAFQLIRRVLYRLNAFELDAGTVQLWGLLDSFIVAIESGQLTLTEQRKRLFCFYDRVLKYLEHDAEIERAYLFAQDFMQEISYVLLLSNASDEIKTQLSYFAEFSSLDINDKAIHANRQLIERNLDAAMADLFIALKDEFKALKQTLEAISESGVCEYHDSQQLSNHCQQIQSAWSLAQNVTQVDLEEMNQQFLAWSDTFPSETELMIVADRLLEIENGIDQQLSRCTDYVNNDSVAESIFSDSQQALYVESKNNLSVVKRALEAYVESDFESAHIANMSQVLEGMAGAFSILNLELAAQLVNKVAVKIDEAYAAGNTENENAIELIADVCIALEYYLEELQSGRGSDNAIIKLLQDSAEALG